MVQNILPQFGIRPEGFGTGGAGRTLERRSSGDGHGRVAAIYLETPANPTNGLVDIARCAEPAGQLRRKQSERPPVIVDNTFFGPFWQQPLALGADLVVYSLTNYVGGQRRHRRGEPRVRDADRGRARHAHDFGTMLDPHTGWLMRSLETLKLRMTGAMKNARYVAEFLADHPKVKKVHYLGFLRRTIRIPRFTGGSASRRARPSPSRCTAASRGVPAAQPAPADPARGEPRRHREPGRAPGHHDAF